MQAEDQAIWWDTLNKMQKILRKAAASLSTLSKIDKDTMHNYFMSGIIVYVYINTKPLYVITKPRIVKDLGNSLKAYSCIKCFSYGTRGYKWYFERKKYKKSLFGLHKIYKQYKLTKFEKSFIVCGYYK